MADDNEPFDDLSDDDDEDTDDSTYNPLSQPSSSDDNSQPINRRQLHKGPLPKRAAPPPLPTNPYRKGPVPRRAPPAQQAPNGNDDNDSDYDPEADDDNINSDDDDDNDFANNVVQRDDTTANDVINEVNAIAKFNKPLIMKYKLIPIGWPNHEFNRVYNIYDEHFKLYNWWKNLFRTGDFIKHKPLSGYNPDLKANNHNVNDSRFIRQLHELLEIGRAHV